MKRILLLALLTTAAGCVAPQPKVVVVHRDRYIPRPAATPVDVDAQVDRDLDAALAAEWPEPSEGGETAYVPPPPPRERVRGETDRVLYVTQTPVVVLGTGYNGGYRGRYSYSSCSPRYVQPACPPPVVNTCGPRTYYGGAVNYGTTYNGHGRGYVRTSGVYGGINYSSPRVSVGVNSGSCAPRFGGGGIRVGVRVR